LIELVPELRIIGFILLAGVLKTAIHHDYANPLKSQSVSFNANFTITLYAGPVPCAILSQFPVELDPSYLQQSVLDENPADEFI